MSSAAAVGQWSLCASPPPVERYDVALLDLDGVVYVGDTPVPHAVEALAAAEQQGMAREYVTNNALRPPQDVAAKLNRLGIRATVEQVVTSAQAAAHLLADRLPAGATVLAVGGKGLRQAVLERGFALCDTADADPAAVVIGYDPEIDYRRLSEAALAVSRGATFVVSNRDATIPSARGLLPGMGALAAVVVTATGREPLVAGKPEEALHAESVRRSGAQRPIVVGDRLDTDVEGARRAGTPSLLVLTGVTDVLALATAPPHRRPDLVGHDLRALLQAHPDAVDGRCRDARARYDSGSHRVVVEVGASRDRTDAVRAAVTVAWRALDEGNRVEGVDGIDG